MASVVIVNPNDKAVDVRVVGESGGFLGFRKVDKTLHVGASSSGSTDVPKGKYYIRYRVGSGDVWQGDSFSLEEGSEAQITLVRVSDGNYGVRPAGGKL